MSVFVTSDEAPFVFGAYAAHLHDVAAAGDRGADLTEPEADVDDDLLAVRVEPGSY